MNTVHRVAVEYVAGTFDSPTDEQAEAALRAFGVEIYAGNISTGDVLVRDQDMPARRWRLVEHDGFRVYALDAPERPSGCGTCTTTGRIRNPRTSRMETCPACNGAGLR